MVITNNGGPVTIDRVFVIWNESSNNQKLVSIKLDATTIWNTSDPNAPSDIPAEGGGNWANGVPAIADAVPHNFVVQFQENLVGTPQVFVVFDQGGGNLCQVVR